MRQIYFSDIIQLVISCFLEINNSKMIYPRNKSSVSQTGSRTKKSFLNPYQREELKKRLVEKFTKLYGLNNPSIIKEEVTAFFKQNSEINAQNLRRLEANVRSVCLKKKSLSHAPAQLPNGTRLSNVGGPSIVSHNSRGAVNSRGGYGNSQLSNAGPLGAQ